MRIHWKHIFQSQLILSSSTDLLSPKLVPLQKAGILQKDPFSKSIQNHIIKLEYYPPQVEYVEQPGNMRMLSAQNF